MSWALRWMLVGICIATAVQYLFSPHPIVLMGAFMVGWVAGVLTFLIDEFFALMSG